MVCGRFLSSEEVEIFSFLNVSMEGGDRMDFVTWSELIYLLIELVTLAFVILSYLNSKKR